MISPTMSFVHTPGAKGGTVYNPGKSCMGAPSTVL